MKIQPVIMSGGAGTRLWPMSRQARPKQFLQLMTNQSMFQETAQRVRPESDNDFLDPVVIAGGGHGALVAEQLMEIDIDPGEIILEPCPRNTAAVAAVAASWVARNHDDALILLMPADHHIADKHAFHASVSYAAHAAKDGFIATFGIKPTHPHTGYGYIECGEKIADSVFKVAAFKEKPAAKTAQEYLSNGGYFWNAGIFLYKASAMLAEMDIHAPEIKAASVNALDKATMSGSALRLNEPAFKESPSNSIDYAVMEKTDKAAIVAPVDVGWTDIGSWSEVASLSDAPNVIEVDGAENNIIRTDGSVVTAVGVKDLVIVATADSVLVARRDNAQEVRAVVDELKKRGRTDLL